MITMTMGHNTDYEIMLRMRMMMVVVGEDDGDK